ncbi:MAG: HsdR family type I site-specific deoxyribonuclease [Puniceicoccales bacterium]|nr:HsdR family type I site-specific deoxyribonuclease [Puniceicoccales bacterium]
MLVGRFSRALARLNPQVPAAVLDEAMQRVLKLDNPVAAQRNRDFHRLLLSGLPVSWREGDAVRHDIARLVDFSTQHLDANEFLVVNQFAIKGPNKTRRPDLVVFINGLPLAIIELKNPADEQTDVWKAWQQLQNYKEEIPDIFNTNEALIVSDGFTARVGSLTADRERFLPWRTIKNEDDKPVVEFEIEKIIRGFFDRELFLDYLKHFILFEQDGDRIVKKIAGYHQFHAVREAVRVTVIAAQESEPDVLEEPRAPYGREVVPGSRKAGVVWHTQGSGKSISMVCYAGKLIQQPEMKNPTLVVVTDRNDLDGQLYETFCGAQELLKQTPEQAESREELRAKLASRQAGGIIFTTIQKFASPQTSESPSPQPSPSGRGSDTASCGRGSGGAGCGRGGGGASYRGGLPVSGLLKRARELRAKQTPAEELLWALLRNRQLAGAKFRRQHQFGKYICDFYCAEAGLIVECDGASHHTPEAMAHDAKRDAYLRASGHTVLRFENNQVLTDTETVLKKISLHLPSPLGRGAGGEGDVATNEFRMSPLNLRGNIVVISDEAHRSQYGLKAKLNTKTGQYTHGFARHLRDALPLASFIGFTGTPIERDDKDTRAVFGNYISIYDIQDAVDDGATVEILYESRLAKLDVNREQIEQLSAQVEEVVEDEEETQREKTKGLWSTLEKLVGARERIEEIAADLVAHFEKRDAVMPGKAMIVGMSRDICARLYAAIVALRPEWHDPGIERGAIKVVITGSASDDKALQPHVTTRRQKKRLEKRFKNPADPLRLVIVRDMWLTGFDVPCCHTMYIDKPMKGHNLMQAIARVNRVFKDKPGGLVVDYIGIANDLKTALKTYADSNGRGQPSRQAGEFLDILRAKLDACRGLFRSGGGFDYSAYEKRPTALLVPAANHILGLPDGKKRFLDLVTAITRAFALCGTLDEADALRTEIAFFSAVKAAIVKYTTVDKKLTEAEKHSALRRILDNAVVSEGVADIFALAGLHKPNIGLLSEAFLEDVRNMPHKNLAVELLEKLLRDEIKAHTRTNVVLRKKFGDRLMDALRKYHNRAVETAQVIEELLKMAGDFKDALDRNEKLGLSPDEIAFYDALAERPDVLRQMGDATLKQLAIELTEHLRSSTTVDWQVRDSVRARMRISIKRLLKKYKYPPEGQEEAVVLVLKQAGTLSDEWSR